MGRWRCKGKKNPLMIPDRIIYSATPRLVRRHVLSPPKNNPKLFVRLSYPCTTNIGPPRCTHQHTSPRGTAAPPALCTLKFPAATLSTWHHQKYPDKFSFPYLCSISSWIGNSSAAILPKLPPFVPSKALFSSRHTIYGLPTTLPLMCLIIPHRQSRHGCQFPSAPAPTSLLWPSPPRPYRYRIYRHPADLAAGCDSEWWHAHNTKLLSRMHDAIEGVSILTEQSASA